MCLTGEFLTLFNHHFNISLCLQKDIFIQVSEAMGRHFSSCFSSHKHKNRSRDFGKLAGISFNAVLRLHVPPVSAKARTELSFCFTLGDQQPSSDLHLYPLQANIYIYLIRCIHTYDGIKFYFISEITLSHILEAPVHFPGTTTQQKWPKEKLFFCHQGIVSCSVLTLFTSLDN